MLIEADINHKNENNSNKINNNDKIKTLESFEVIINTINHVLIGSITLFLCYLCYKAGYSKVTLHVLCFTISYILLMSEAILTLYKNNVWTRLLIRPKKIILHLLFQTFGLGFAIAGFILEFQNKTSTHFVSNHEITGLISLCFLLVSWLNGFVGAFAQYGLKKQLWWNNRNKFVHNCLTISTFLIGFISIIFSYNTRWAQRVIEIEVSTALQVLTGLVAAFTLIAPLRNLVYQIKSFII